jgi:hypothetical protein
LGRAGCNALFLQVHVGLTLADESLFHIKCTPLPSQ